MSGAPEGIAGLALSAVSVAALFTTCIECFDIVVAGKNFSEDFEQLCALFSLERTRFGLWGESVGLIPCPSTGHRLRYDRNIDRPDIRPQLERILNNIKSLLEEGNQINRKFSEGPISDQTNSRGIQIFKPSFERFKSHIRKHQKDTSAWKVTRWAIHDAKKFERMIDRLADFVDGLEKITKSLGLLEQQHARLKEEIDSISDVESLRLLRDASSNHSSPSQKDVTDTASERLLSIGESSIVRQFTISTGSTSDATVSFHTARTGQSSEIQSLTATNPPMPGAWPRSVTSNFKKIPKTAFRPNPSCEECLEEHYKCVTKPSTASCSRCTQVGRECSFSVRLEEDFVSGIEPVVPLDVAIYGLLPQDLPQNQREIKELVSRVGRPLRSLSFANGDAHFGDSLTNIKNEDSNYWIHNSARLLSNAQSGTSAFKRMFLELRDIRKAKIPFISAVPLNDSLDKVLASIEGPPETPYEGGVFWITVKLSTKNPEGPPLMRFNTKIYHPNISPQGRICAEYSNQWNDVLSAGHNTASSSDWYSGGRNKTRWSLGALLTALCGLLASPDVDDPLVLEIARTYFENYEQYCANARLYTEIYATKDRPVDEDLLFPDETSSDDSYTRKPNDDLNDNLDNISDKMDAISLQNSLRQRFDEKFATSKVKATGIIAGSYAEDITTLMISSNMKSDVMHRLQFFENDCMWGPGISLFTVREKSMLHQTLCESFWERVPIDVGILIDMQLHAALLAQTIGSVIALEQRQYLQQLALKYFATAIDGKVAQWRVVSINNLKSTFVLEMNVNGNMGWQISRDLGSLERAIIYRTPWESLWQQLDSKVLLECIETSSNCGLLSFQVGSRFLEFLAPSQSRDTLFEIVRGYRALPVWTYDMPLNQ